MKLRNIDFGDVLGASGVQGFFGEGYWFHKIWNPFYFDFTNMTFVAKTTTLLPQPGNMSLTQHYTPRNPFPGCVKAKLRRGVMLNSVGLSNPGLGALLGTSRWQKNTKPFLISIMSLGETPQRRLEELRIMVETIGLCKGSFSAPFGLQINLSCPNTGHDPHELIGESAKVLEIASTLGVPVMPKYGIASAPILAILQLNNNPNCDAICVSNTLPFGWQGVDWQQVWGSTTSPLAKLGGGGILCPRDAEHYHDAGASSIFLGSVAVLRPWRVRAIINHANSLKW